MKLLTIMLEAGFVHHPHEWWHYQLPDAHQFPLIDSHAFMSCVAGGSQRASAAWGTSIRRTHDSNDSLPDQPS